MLPSLSIALATLLSLTSVATAIPTSSPWLNGFEPRAIGRTCGSDLTPEAVREKENSFISLLAEKKASDRVTVTEEHFTIPVNFNVIYASMNISDGYIP